tara:strand:+ start:18705 stop:19430 length:726 start_codon:yes stop_codon:yes gene_type:complete
MTLTELSNFVTTKLSDTDSSSVSVCKDFINRRYQMIWDSGLWDETLGVASKAVAAEDTEIVLDSTPTVTFYQSSSVPTTKIDFPVAIRFTETGDTDGVNIFNEEWVTFFQLDPNMWENVSSRRATPTNFVNLPKDGSGNCRIKPVPVPDSTGTLFVLGKLKWVALGDDDSPTLNGIDNALLAFAEGDMLERSRQYQKAQLKFTEAASHIQIMRDLENGQKQNISRIIPHTEQEINFRDVVS